jgi:hypothetical protein
VTHEYPPNRAFDSISISRVSALREYGLTLRQREFLVTVMVHSGCFLERQYCEFTGTVRGQNSRDFMARLVARGFARAIEPGPVRRGRLYHVHHRPECFMAIGAADEGRTSARCALAAPVTIKPFGLNRYAGASLWGLNRQTRMGPRGTWRGVGDDNG